MPPKLNESLKIRAENGGLDVGEGTVMTAMVIKRLIFFIINFKNNKREIIIIRQFSKMVLLVAKISKKIRPNISTGFWLVKIKASVEKKYTILDLMLGAQK